eukprot:scaffold259_cov252-Pinguiococcus_pyrenoidosus.AAC.49
MSESYRVFNRFSTLLHHSCGEQRDVRGFLTLSAVMASKRTSGSTLDAGSYVSKILLRYATKAGEYVLYTSRMFSAFVLPSIFENRRFLKGIESGCGLSSAKDTAGSAANKATDATPCWQRSRRLKCSWESMSGGSRGADSPSDRRSQERGEIRPERATCKFKCGALDGGAFSATVAPHASKTSAFPQVHVIARGQWVRENPPRRPGTKSRGSN